MRNLALAAAIALLILPAAQAQDATSQLSLTVGTLPGPIAYDGNASMPVTVTIGCVALLQNVDAPATTATVMVTNATPPSWLTVTPASIVLDAASCAPPGNTGGFVTGTGNVGLRVKPDAPGVVVQHALITATLGDLNATQPADFNVTYHANHTITPSIQFPHTMQGGRLNFTVTVTMNGNARSMVMFDNVRASTGAVSGLGSENYEPGQTRVFNVTYTAPNTPWTQANLTFAGYSHYLLEGSAMAGGSNLAKNETWVVLNGNEDGGTGSENSPLPVALMVAALVAAVIVARRKR